MPRSRSLSLNDIATAALQVIDGEGLAALSMRSTAAILGIGTMSLYRYVVDRDALERLVVDHVLAAVDTDATSREPWDQKLARQAECVRLAVGAHPAIVPLLVRHRHTSQGVKRFAEAFLRTLAEGGFNGQHRAIALRTLVSYLSGALQAQHLGPLDGPGTEAMATLPPDEYPLLAATAQAAQDISPDEEFRRGLGIVLRGLAHEPR